MAFNSMTDKITLELTLDELKVIDKYVELNDETQSVFDKIKYAYPQLKMTLHREGDYVVVSYNNTTYYRLIGEDSTWFGWYIKKGGNDNYLTPTLVMVTDAETERLLEGLYYNHIVVKKEKEMIRQNLKTSLQELANGDVRPIDDVIEEAKKEKEQRQKELVRESVKWCEENPDKDPLDWLKPQTPEQVADGLKEAFREAVKQGVVSSANKPKTLTDLIYRWWDDVFTTHSDWDMETSIEDLVDQIQLWLPKEQSAAGSQNAYVESAVEGFNDCLTKIKGKLR